MASVNFEKFKSMIQAKAVIRHNDKYCREATHAHSNDHIDKSLTKYNLQLKSKYADVCNRLDERIAYLDSLPGANKRKDRVLMLGLEIPAPKDLKPEHQKDWFLKVYKLIARQYGQDNILQMYVHMDEVHDYVDAATGEARTSRVHAHIPVIPEHEGKLNAKHCSSRANMIKLNNAIQQMTENDYGVKFMDGSHKKSKASVEALKRASERREHEDAIKSLQKQKNGLQDEIQTLQTELLHVKELHELERKRKARENADFREFLRVQAKRREGERTLIGEFYSDKEGQTDLQRF